jgi:protein-disulfide isomerase
MVNARQAKTAREKAAAMRAEAARQEARRRALTIASAVVAAIIVAVGTGILIQTARHNEQAKIQAASAPPANLTNGALLVGKPSAKATVEIWEDFQCPACKNFETLNGAQLAAWAADGTAKIEYHPVAILDHQSSTEYSTRALNAAAAVINVDPKAFVKFHSLLYANQPEEGGSGLPDSQLIDYAVQAGVQRTAVESAITNRKYAGWVTKVTDEFSSVKHFTATPTIVINGKAIKDYAPTSLKAAVDAAQKG